MNRDRSQQCLLGLSLQCRCGADRWWIRLNFLPERKRLTSLASKNTALPHHRREGLTTLTESAPRPSQSDSDRIRVGEIRPCGNPHGKRSRHLLTLRSGASSRWNVCVHTHSHTQRQPETWRQKVQTAARAPPARAAKVPPGTPRRCHQHSHSGMAEEVRVRASGTAGSSRTCHFSTETFW